MALFKPSVCAVFFRTRDKWGGFSNMCAGFPLVVQAEQFRTSEALYQALRFPDHPDIQELIRAEKSPMAAKMVAKGNTEKTRSDWDDVRVGIMRFAVSLKCVQHPNEMGKLFTESGTMPIVEKSRKDPFWGALETDGGMLEGQNVLGDILMDIRATIEAGRQISVLAPAGCKIFGKEI